MRALYAVIAVELEHTYCAIMDRRGDGVDGGYTRGSMRSNATPTLMPEAANATGSQQLAVTGIGITGIKPTDGNVRKEQI
jgi:hypothetical protein